MTHEDLCFSVYPGAHAAPIDTLDQVREAFDRARADAENSGLAFSNVLKLRFFYTEPENFVPMNTVRNAAYPDWIPSGEWPASTGVTTGGRGGVAPQFECQFIFGPGNVAANSADVVSQWGESVPKFRHAQKSGRTVFLSGQGAYHVDGTLMGSDARSQTVGALGTFEPILDSAALDLSALISITAYLTPDVFDEVALISQIIDEFCEQSGIAPVVTFIPVAVLSWGMSVEIEAIASSAYAEFCPQVRPDGALGFHPRSAVAVATDALCYAALPVTVGRRTVGEVISQAWRTVAAAFTEVGAVCGERMITLWYSRELSRASIEEAMITVIGPQAHLTIAPFGGSVVGPAIILEILGTRGGRARSE